MGQGQSAVSLGDEQLFQAVAASDALEWARQARPNPLQPRHQRPESAVSEFFPPANALNTPASASTALAPLQIPALAAAAGMSPAIDSAGNEKSLEDTLAELRTRLLSAKKPVRMSDALAAAAASSSGKANSAPVAHGTNGTSVRASVPLGGFANTHRCAMQSAMQVDDDDNLDGAPVNDLASLKSHPLAKRMLQEYISVPLLDRTVTSSAV